MTVHGFSFFYRSDPIWRFHFYDFFVRAEISFFLVRWRWNWVKFHLTLTLLAFVQFFSLLLIIQCFSCLLEGSKKLAQVKTEVCWVYTTAEGLRRFVDWRRVRISGLLTNARVLRYFVCIIITTSNIDIIEWIFFSTFFYSLLFHFSRIPKQIRRINNCMRTGNRCSVKNEK